MLVDQELARHRGRYYGKYAGTVTDPKDPEKLGRVQVNVPALFAEPVWARPCLPFGFFFIPPASTQVWVEFEAGDLERPIWSGTWLGTDQWAEEAAEPGKDQVFKPRPGFFLAVTDEGITLQVGEETKLLIQPDDKGIILQVNASNSIKIEPGKVTLTGEAIEAVKG